MRATTVGTPGTHALGPAQWPREPGALSLLLGGSLLTLPFAALVVCACAFASGHALRPGMALPVLCAPWLFAVPAARRLGFSQLRYGWGTGAVALGLFALCAAASAALLDLGYDSQSYHQLGILTLMRGWNPFHAPAPVAGPYALYAAHYAIGPWMQAALVALATGSLEAGKAFHLVWIAASVCIAYGALRNTGLARPPLAAVLAATAGLNPVAVAQCTTFYVDGLLASELVVLCALLALLAHRPRPLWLGLAAMAIALIANTKFTGIVYVLPLLLGACAATWLLHRGAAAARVACVLTSALAAAVLLFGYHPYVTNTLAHGHPFHPLYGAARAHDIQFLRPLRILGAGRLERLLVSVFADAGRDFAHASQLVKWPLTIGAGELTRFGTPDPRVAGWGPLFSAALLLACAGFTGLVLQRRERVRAGYAALAIAALCGSALANPECWWARFTPQLSFVPLIVTLLLETPRRRSFAAGWAGAALLVLGVANHGLVLASTVRGVATRQAAVNGALTALGAAGSTVYISSRWPAPLYRLAERGIPFVAIPDDGEDPDPALWLRMPCAPLREFPGSMGEVRYCSRPAPVGEHALSDAPRAALSDAPLRSPRPASSRR